MVHTIWLARHGNRQDFVDSDWITTAERPYDPGLSTDGVAQARLLASRLGREQIAALFASPFLRCIETANHIAEALDLSIYVEPGLSEWLNSEWFPERPQTMPPDLLVRRFPRVDLSYEPRVQPSYPESEDDAMRRSAQAAHAIASDFSGPVLLVGHSISVSGVAAGLDTDASIRECGFCCVFKFEREDDGWRVKVNGDVSHIGETVTADG